MSLPDFPDPGLPPPDKTMEMTRDELERRAGALNQLAGSTLAIPRADFEAWCKSAGKPIVDAVAVRITQEIKKPGVSKAEVAALAGEVLAVWLGVENIYGAAKGLYERQTEKLFTNTHIIDIVGKVMSDVVGHIAGPLEDLVKDLPNDLARLLIEKIRKSRGNAKKPLK